MVLLRIVERLGCTPSQASHELAHNPEVMDLLALSAYETAYIEMERWDALTPEQRRDGKRPHGHMADMVREHRAQLVRERIEGAP